MGGQTSQRLSSRWQQRVDISTSLYLGRWNCFPLGVVFEALHGNFTDTWMEGITEETQIFTTSSPTGRINDKIGVAWLSQVFDRYTNEKAGRCWRLLFLDGQGSHTTCDFLAFCVRNRILLMIYPPMLPTTFRCWI
jgi:hypothetical protein